MKKILKETLKLKFRTIFAVSYFLIVIFVLCAAIFGGEFRQNAADLAFYLTLPLSLISLLIIFILGLSLDGILPMKNLAMYFYLIGYAVCAVINAAIIYLFISFISRILRAIVKKPLK